jgi:hypothetical protein
MSKELPKILLQSLKMEYEQTPISMEDLCSKHKLSMSQLPSDWTKEYEATPNISIVLPSDSKGQLTISQYDEEPDESEEIKSSLNKTAKALIKEVQSMISTNPDLTPRDLKDIATTLIAIKDSVLGKDPTVKIDLTNNTQVNLLTNIVSQIKGATRDC